ncbi:MAG: hypothetical protein AAB784_02130 [Patescibacteria group bacterium]
MEKIILKPIVKELLHKNSEDGIHFDVLSYQGTSNQEKTLGSLFVIGQIKYSDEDQSYAVSLVSSLAKREYYSEQSIYGQDAKKAFEHTLGKLNEILDDFFKSKNLKINMGLMAISGSDIYISRLGKFKVSLTRNDKFIDVLNNIELFNKDSEDAKKFSNIISGKLNPQDKFFAYIPTRSISVREKQLNEVFVNEDQEVFSQKIAQLASSVNSFSCCGVHINMSEVREVPATIKQDYTKPTLANKTIEQAMQETAESATPTIIPAETVVARQTPTIPTVQEKPKIIPAEFSITKRGTILTPLMKQIFKLKNIANLNVRSRSKVFSTLALIVILPLLAIAIYRSIGPSNEIKNVLNKAQEDLRLAQSFLNQNNLKDARSLLQATILNTSSISDKQAIKINEEIRQTLNSINKMSVKQPELYHDATSSDFKIQLISALDNQVSVSDQDGTIYSVEQTAISETSKLNITSKLLFNTPTTISLFNGSDTLAVYNKDSKKTTTHSLENPIQAIDAVLYESNLYTLADNSIHKYSDAITGGTKRTNWGSDNASGSLISITADGSIYTLNADGKLITYFKGSKTKEIDLQITPNSGSKIFTFKDSAFLYLSDKTLGLVYVFDKSTGELKTTYDLFGIYGESTKPAVTINNISVSPDGSVWAISSDNKVWVIR